MAHADVVDRRVQEAVRRRADLLDRFLQGRAAWNAWAAAKSAEWLEMLHSGQWADSINRHYLDDPDANAPPASWWLEEAAADFVRMHFHFTREVSATFCPLPPEHPVRRQARLARMFSTPCLPKTEGGWFDIHLWLPGKELDLRQWRFPGNVSFSGCSVDGTLDLSGMDFSVELEFCSTRVDGDLVLDDIRVFWMFHVHGLRVARNIPMRRACFFELFETHRLQVGGNVCLQGAMLAHADADMKPGDVLFDAAEIGGGLDLSGAHFFNRRIDISGQVRQVHLAGAKGTPMLILKEPECHIESDERAVLCGGLHQQAS